MPNEYKQNSPDPLSKECLLYPQYGPLLAHGSIDIEHETVYWTAIFSENKLAIDGLSVFLSGFGAPKHTSTPFASELAVMGYPNITFTPPRRNARSRWQRTTDPQSFHAEAITAVTNSFRKQTTLRKSLPHGDTLDLDNELLITHSMGGLSASRYAQTSTRVQDIIHISAVGFGSPTLRDIMTSVPLGLKDTLVKEIVPGVRNKHVEISTKYILEMLRHCAVSPGQTIDEALSCVLEDVRPRHQELRKRGIKIGYLAAQYDTVVRPKANIARHVDTYHVMPGLGHIAPQCKPNRVANAVHEMHKNLQKLSQNR
jgi:pimeloyl-ACP methyl ester carboxylesterase